MQDVLWRVKSMDSEPIPITDATIRIGQYERRDGVIRYAIESSQISHIDKERYEELRQKILKCANVRKMVYLKMAEAKNAKTFFEPNEHMYGVWSFVRDVLQSILDVEKVQAIHNSGSVKKQ